jgi:hypothetical protein
MVSRCYFKPITKVDELYAELKALYTPNGDLQDMPQQMRQFSVLDNNRNIIHFGETTAKQ